MKKAQQSPNMFSLVPTQKVGCDKGSKLEGGNRGAQE